MQDLGGLDRELGQGPVAVVAGPQVDLGQAPDADGGEGVEQQADVDPVALDEGQGLHEGAPGCVLARQGLDHGGQGGVEEREGRAGQELSDPAPAGLAPRLGALVEALHELDVGLGQERAQQTGDERRVEVPQVGVAPHDEVAGAGQHGLPQGLALARFGPELRGDVGRGHDPGPGGGRHLGRGVGGVVVEDEDLVHQRGVADQRLLHRGNDRADGRGLVTGGQAQGDPPAPLRRDQVVGGEAGVVEGAHRSHRCRTVRPTRREWGSWRTPDLSWCVGPAATGPHPSASSTAIGASARSTSWWRHRPSTDQRRRSWLRRTWVPRWASATSG